MASINAQTVNRVNAYSGNGLRHHRRMGKVAESEPSEFWERLVEAWRPKGLPLSQNGVATELDMSQGSTRRWYLGEGLPETEILKKIALKGDVTIDWLLTGRLPKHPLDPRTMLGAIHANWAGLDPGAQKHVYDDLKGQLALHSTEHAAKPAKAQKGR